MFRKAVGQLEVILCIIGKVLSPFWFNRASITMLDNLRVVRMYSPLFLNIGGVD